MDDDDPFDGVSFDEGFVRGGRREPSAAERLERAAREREVIELEAERRRLERAARRRRRRPGAVMRRHLRLVPAVAFLVVLALAAWQLNREGSTTGTLWLAGPEVGAPVAGGRPTPRAAPSDAPLGVPPVATGTGAHVFMSVQPGGLDPVAYDPCRPISVVINGRTAPPSAEGLVAEALQITSEATGLRFELEGITDEPPVAQRSAFQEDRYGDRWAPVLIAWTDPAEVPELGGDVAGIGGSSWIDAARGGPAVYVSGIVALDGPQLASIIDGVDGRAQALGVVLHELGHLVGLGHVDDPGQLMHPVGQYQITTFQDGDLAGLARLGAGACVGEL
ncbi:SCO2583/SCO2584 N-terminal domain-containing protein [Actinomarinicola tropica]|uniref:Matrixin family metalloprotease n=1 Tax=Actinomarinicola tropica TaxID=2789776 RepID=A0A5Q2RM80_9ACTN|nr:matrixin family metalloprotease [Actinomarinicola tropica]QGG94295.1 matrixin family metalloprotease [Actinomarinicola tropica]